MDIWNILEFLYNYVSELFITLFIRHLFLT